MFIWRVRIQREEVSSPMPDAIPTEAHLDVPEVVHVDLLARRAGHDRRLQRVDPRVGSRQCGAERSLLVDRDEERRD